MQGNYKVSWGARYGLQGTILENTLISGNFYKSWYAAEVHTVTYGIYLPK